MLNWRFRITGVNRRRGIRQPGRWMRYCAWLEAATTETATRTVVTSRLFMCVLRARQFSVHSESDVMSLTKTRLPETAGWAQVALSATVYRFSGSNPFLLLLATISSAVVVQQQEQIACLDDGGIRGLTGLTEPENLAAVRVEREELPSRLLGQAEQRVADDHRIAQKQRDILGLPHDVDDPLVAARGRLQRGHAHGLAADDQRLPVQDRGDGARRRAGRPRILPKPCAIG